MSGNDELGQEKFHFVGSEKERDIIKMRIRPIDHSVGDRKEQMSHFLSIVAVFFSVIIYKCLIEMGQSVGPTSDLYPSFTLGKDTTWSQGQVDEVWQNAENRRIIEHDRKGCPQF